MQRRVKYSLLTQPVNKHLTRKYDIHFNFFLTKPTNQILFNQTTAPATLTFKDAAIFADHNDYLKRYYFLKNALDKDEIFDRIRLLAQFYGSAVLLRYEYPLMVLTKTKSVFLKRLKRMKKILVEQGSSDESNSDHDQRAVSINSSQFLKSVSSSELQRKSLEDGNRLELDFSLNEFETETYDIYNDQDGDEPIQNSLFLANIDRLTRGVACELVLQQQHNEDQVKHLVLDFDQFDKDEVLRRYSKIVEKENRTENSSKQSWLKEGRTPKQPQRVRDLLEKKPMASSITITALNDHRPPHQNQHSKSNQPTKLNQQFKKKSLISPVRVSQFGTIRPPPMKRSSYYQYELQHNNFPLSNEFVIAEDEMEDSPRHSAKHRQRPHENLGYLSSRETNRDRFRFQEPNLISQTPATKYSHILNSDEFKTKSKIFSNLERQEKGSPSKPRDYDYGKDYYDYGRYGQPNNRMTSINININNLEQKKQRVNVNVNKNKFGLGEQFEEEEKNYRAEKKKKIREKAAALLNRVKSQEHMRVDMRADDYDYRFADDSNPYFQRYYN